MMKHFLKKIIKYALLTASLWITHIIILVLIVVFLPKHYVLYHNNIPVKEKKYFILGNSHPECAINDTLLGKDFKNVAQSGEPLFYTCIKAQNIINQVNPDTLIIEFENTSLNTIHLVLANNRLFFNYKRYFSIMSLQNHRFLFENNFLKAVKTLLFLNLGDILNYNNISGGYLYLIKDNIISPPKKKEKTKKNLNYSTDVQVRNIESLFNLIRNNDSTFFIITRMPLHKKADLSNESIYLNYVNKLSQFKNCKYLDFNGKIALADSCYGDETHLNFRGAKIFTPIFKSAFQKLRVENNITHP